MNRDVVEGIQSQGVDESIAYTITTTNWGSSPSSVAVAAYKVLANSLETVTSTVLSGSASVTGDIITLPKLQTLTAGYRYRLEVKFTCSGNIFECFVNVDAEE